MASAHETSFSSTMSYSATQPSGGAASVSNWTGAAFDADNIGGSGVNADGGSDNGAANDDFTYVANNRPVQGQSFLTGSATHGYELHSVTARMAGYTNNTASGSNVTSWNLNEHTGPILLTVVEISGTTRSMITRQLFKAGSTGTPGSGTSVNGSGDHITFELPFTTHLKPNTTYGFEIAIGNGSSNHFEWLGTRTDPYADGTAYHYSGDTITPVAGDHVFQADMTALASPPPVFAHPGTLHTQADLDRMKAKVDASEEPWKSSFDTLAASPWAQTGWPAYNVDYIVRGGSGNNYTRSQQDAQAIYELALRWHLTGDTAYADKAVQIANVWSDLVGIQGDTNASLAAGICGYLFASGGELLSTYSGWPEAEKQAYKDMMMRVFYPRNLDFLWRHHDTPFTKGGNSHYRLNWDTANMASVAAIGILCDNHAVYQQAVDYFKYGTGNGRVERAAWYLFPDGTSQTEESGRDQAHNLGGWHAMALLCQMAWNQGEDLFGYDNNRVLRAFEYNAKFNLGNNVPWVFHRNTTLDYTETLTSYLSGIGQYYQYELVHNHYANVKGVAAPWSKLVIDATRPEPRPNPSFHPSQVDWFGLGSLTYARDPIAAGVAPSGLVSNWSKNQVVLNWWGTASATGYEVKRATSAGGPYTTLGTVTGADLNFTDTSVSNGAIYYYIVTANTPSGDLDSQPLEVKQSLVTHYSFEGNANDSVGTRHAAPLGGTTAPGYATGFGGGQAISLNGSDQYVQLPVGSGNYQDITIATWVRWNGGGNWQRIFDFGSEIEKSMFLTPSKGGSMEFAISTSRFFDGTGRLNGPVLPTGQWVHVAVTLNGDTGTLYVNGLPVDAKPIDGVDPLFAQPFCYLGRSMWNNDSHFNGLIDDFRIYNHALSGSEVYTLWGQSSNNPPAFTTDPIDKSAATEDSAYTGQTIAGSATDADGGTPTYSKVTGPAWLSVASDGTLSGTPTNDDAGDNVFVVRATDASGATDDATLRITVTNTNDVPVWSSSSFTTASVSRGQPYVGETLAGMASDVDAGSTITYSKFSGPAWLAVAADGTLSGTPGAGDSGSNVFTVRVTDDIGASSDATLTIEVFPYEMRTHLAFEDNTTDSLGNFDGTATGSPAYQAAQFGQAIVLDGSDDYVALPAGAASYHDITIATWVNWNGGGNWQRIFDFGNDTSHYLYLTPNNGSGMRFGIKNGGGDQQLNTSALATGQWVHLAVTLEGDTGTLYVNGAVANTNTGMTLNPDDFDPTKNYIGKSQFSDPLFNGQIDDFRIYNQALSASQVADLAAAANPPATPGGLGASAVSPVQIDLSWSAALGAETYHVKRATVSGGPYTTIASPTGTSFSDIGLSASTTYYYVLSASNISGESADSGETNATTLTNPPATPGGLSANVVSATQIDLNWNTASGATSYHLKRATTSGGPYTTIASPAGTSFSDIGLSADTTYYYVVSASNAGGESADSSETNAVTLPDPPTAPDGLAATAISPSEIDLTWDPVTGASGYSVKRAASSGGPYTTLATDVTVTTFSDTGLSESTAYYYVVSASNTGGESPDSAEASATTPSNIPAAPTDLVATAVSTSAIDLSWTASSGADSYHVKRATASGGPYTTIASPTGTVFSDTGLSESTSYYYVVSAVNTSGESADSTEASATTAGLQVHLAFDETTGTTAADSGPGGASPGTLVNGPTWATGALDNAVELDGTDDHVTLPTGVVADLSDFTIATWVRLDSVSNWQRVFDFGTGTSVNMFLTAANGSTGTPRFAITTSGGSGEQRITAPSALATGSWVHLAVTLSGSTGRLYVDGTEVASNTSMTLDPASLGNTTLNYIGKSQYPDPYLDGKVDDFRIYDHALSTLEIGSLAAMPQAPDAPTGLTATAISATEIDLSWTASTGADSYSVKRATVSGGPYTTLASPTGTTFSVTGLSDGTTYYYVVSATNQFGESGDSSEASASTPYDLGPLPTVWSSGDIGAVSATGVSGHTDGVYTVVGSGADIWDAADEFQFVHQPINGDCDIRARVVSIDNTDPWAKAGVMIRESLAADSTHATTVVSSSSGISFQRRTTTGGNSAHTTTTGLAAPYWVRLVRAGDLFTAYRSTDGVNWTTMGSETISMTATVYAGLAVTSHNDGVLAAGTFDNVSITALPSPWETADIGAVGAAGSTTQTDGEFTVDGSGSDIWGTSDEFRYVYQTASGDCELVARVTSVEGTHNWAKAGVMIRESLNANSRHASVVVTPGQGVSFQRRATTGGSSSSTTNSGLSAPYWVRVVRSGDTLTAYRSADGSSWTTIGSQTIPMSANVYLGLAVTSHSDGTVCTATLESVTATP